MLDYNTKMMRMSYDSILYVLENEPQADNETNYIAVTKHNKFIVYKTNKNKLGLSKLYVSHRGEYFDCSAALDAALYRK